MGRHSGLAAQAGFTVGTSWAEFHYSTKHRGWNPFENVLSPNNVSSIDDDWSYTTGNIVEDTPAVSGGEVYFGSDDHNVYALNASTGAMLWTFTTGNQIFSSPAVAGEVVYADSGDGNVYALNATTGAKLWSYTTGAEVASSPAVANGVVYVGSNDGNLYALNASTGAKLSSLTTGGDVESSPAVANGVVYVGSNDDSVYAFDLAGGLASTVAASWRLAASHTTVRNLTVGAVPRGAQRDGLVRWHGLPIRPQDRRGAKPSCRSGGSLYNSAAPTQNADRGLDHSTAQARQDLHLHGPTRRAAGSGRAVYDAGHTEIAQLRLIERLRAVGRRPRPGPLARAPGAGPGRSRHLPRVDLEV